MLDKLDFERALLRGRYARALTQVEVRGVPIDVGSLQRFRNGWREIRAALISQSGLSREVYDDASFRTDRFEAWLSHRKISWPRSVSGRPYLDDETFRSMALSHPAVRELRDVRKTLATMRNFDLHVGNDGRSRPPLRPWKSRTGRNQPSTSHFVFGMPAWVRSFIKPLPGRALSYVDWSQQEFGIAAALSRDLNMMAAYSSGDPYLAFARQAGAVPEHATKMSHELERERFKACTLAVQYGMGADSLAKRIGQTRAHAAALLGQHRRAYPYFWGWSDRVISYGLEQGKLTAAYGWQIRLEPQMNERSLRNFPVQSNGAEMMRIACILAVEAGVEVCAPVHDAFLIEAGTDEIEEAEARMQDAMREASQLVLDGFALRSDCKRIAYPDRYRDPRGVKMWARVQSLLEESHQVREDEPVA